MLCEYTVRLLREVKEKIFPNEILFNLFFGYEVMLKVEGAE